MDVNPLIAFSISIVITIVGSIFIIKRMMRKYRKKTLIANSIMGIFISSMLILLYLEGEQRLRWYGVFIVLTWLSLLYFPWGLKFRMGDLMFDYWERGATKQLDTIQKNIKELRKEKWFSELYDNGIYGTDTCNVIFGEPFRTMLEQDGIVDSFITNGELREKFIKRIKDEHMADMVRSYGLQYAEKLTGNKDK